MKRSMLSLLLSFALLSGCAAGSRPEKRQYQATFLTLFDTVTTVVGYAEREENFQAQAQVIYDQLLNYHQLFNIYEEYVGMNNLKTVNDNAGIAPVKVEQPILDLLLDCRELYEQTEGRVNVAMGSVLQLWHQARREGVEDPEGAALPEWEQLQQAAAHMEFDTVLIDEVACTVYLADPDQRLDVGAIAKGWAVERVCRAAPSGLLLSVGGNVCATGPRPTDGSPWVVGIQDPDGEEEDYLHTLYLSRGSVVTSGDDQRYYTVDGRRYHHIIDPDTLYPADRWRCVSVLCADSGVADALSTALFTLPLEEGMALAAQWGVEAMWQDKEGQLHYTPGFEAYVRT